MEEERVAPARRGSLLSFSDVEERNERIRMLSEEFLVDQVDDGGGRSLRQSSAGGGGSDNAFSDGWVDESKIVHVDLKITAITEIDLLSVMLGLLQPSGLFWREECHRILLFVCDIVCYFVNYQKWHTMVINSRSLTVETPFDVTGN